MDIQITDFENSALTCLSSLLVELINRFDLNFIMPVSLIDENLERAHKRDAINSTKFYFRKNIIPKSHYFSNDLEKYDWQKSNDLLNQEEEKDEIIEMTLSEIFLGSENGFKGLIPLMRELIDIKEFNYH